MIFFGFSQTTYFKDWLRDSLVETLNEQINGKLSIGEIDGTIFTSLIVRNATLSDTNSDTVISAELIEVRTSPLKLLFKNIYARHIELQNVYVKLIEEKDGKLNIAKIFPSTEEPEDTTKSEFPFTISISSLNLVNINFSLQKYNLAGSTEYYPSMNFDDFRIRDLNLSLSGFADLNKYDYQIQLDKLSFEPNFKFFKLKNLSGRFLLTNNAAGVENLNIETEDTEINLSAGITYVDFLNDFSVSDLKNAPLRVELNINKFSMNSLTTFVPQLDIIGGNFFGKVIASGTLDDLNVRKIELYTGKTSIVANAKLKHVLVSDSLFIDASLDNSYIYPPDIKSVLKIPDMNDYAEFGLVKFNELKYKGSSSSFVSDFALESMKGKIKGNAFMDFSSDTLKYKGELITERFSLSPFTGIPSNLNSKILFSGAGTYPQMIDAKVQFDAGASSFGKLNINSFQMNLSAKDHRAEFDLKLLADTAKVSLSGVFDYLNSSDPYHNLNGFVHDLNLAKILNNDDYKSRINIDISSEGRGLDPDSMDLFLVTDIKNSFFTDYAIDSTRIILDVRRNESGNKIVNLVSDIADITLQGDFYITSLAKAFANESEIIIAQIRQKLNPVLGSNEEIVVNETKDSPLITNSSFFADILLDFKEFVPFKFNHSEIEIGGVIKGKVIAKERSLSLKLNSDIDYLKYVSEEKLYFLTGAKFNIGLFNERVSGFSYNTEIKLNFSSDRIYAGTNFYDSKLNILYNNGTINISSGGFIRNNLRYDFTAKSSINSDSLDILIPDLKIIYRGLPIINKNNLLITYSKGDFIIKNFALDVAEGKITLSGKFGESSDGKTTLNVSDINSEILTEKLFSMPKENAVKSKINITGELFGNFSDPKFNLLATVKDIIISGKRFGTLISNIDYSDNLLNTNVRIIDKTPGVTVPELSIVGYIPLKLSGNKSSANNSDELNLHIESDNFNLSSLGNIIPTLDFKGGMLETEIFIEGTIEKPLVTGYFSVISAEVKSLLNNLSYDFNTRIYWDNEDISFETISLSNKIGTRYGGTLNGNGKIILDGLSFSDAEFRFNGDLKVLDKISKEVNPTVYGDLAVATRDDIKFTMNKEEMNLNMALDVTEADLVFPLSKTAYSGATDFKYRWVDYDSTKNIFESQLDSLLRKFESRELNNNNETFKRKFNYVIDVKLDTEAKMVVLLSKELNQDLTAVLSGNIILSSVDGLKRTSGQFNLLEGSKLSFIKSFEATGNIKFENLNNPLLDITATYTDYYYPIGESGNATEQEVAVKIKLKGPLSELKQSFVKDPDNIGVYIGTENILKDQKDPTKTPSDAVFFIIAGKFTDGATTQERDAVASTATSFAGTVLGGVLNQYVGDYVRSIQLRQIGSETKFSLIGRVSNFRYEIGGTTEVFQDLSRANIKIDWPVTRRLLLRLERKESFVNRSLVNAELYNEFGIKYLFEF